ncbi:hypothetical protein CMUS01_15424 [Colletotrichum musicola]|uniref:Uncharacterized protein n=1 Tax=Colletotrichum musicola TaxID=2175873 RepID=A0A8H6IWT0_9PEZI|nr:hypothetical protein CMUS01_15424 [Colletotrichum musicola]
MLVQLSPTNAPSVTFARNDTRPDDDGINVLYTIDQRLFLLILQKIDIQDMGTMDKLTVMMTVEGVAARLFCSTGLASLYMPVNLSNFKSLFFEPEVLSAL